MPEKRQDEDTPDGEITNIRTNHTDRTTEEQLDGTDSHIGEKNNRRMHDSREGTKETGSAVNTSLKNDEEQIIDHEAKSPATDKGVEYDNPVDRGWAWMILLGLQRRFRHLVPHQIYINCRNHKLALCVKHLLKEFPVLETLDSLLIDIWKLFHFSPQRFHVFMDVQESYNMKKLSFMRAAATRWLSHGRACSRLLDRYTAILDCLDGLYDRKKEAEILGLRNMLTDKKTLSAAVVLCDILKPVIYFSDYLQGDVHFSRVNSRLQTLKDELEHTIERYQSVADGHQDPDLYLSRLAGIWQEIDDRTTLARRLRDVRVLTVEQIVAELGIPMIHKLIFELDDGFRCSPVLDGFRVFELKDVPITVEELNEFGEGMLQLVAMVSALKLSRRKGNITIIPRSKCGCFIISMLAIGGLKSFGVLYVELEKKFDVSNQALSTVQSITGFFYLALGPVCNALSTTFTHRVVVFTGGVLTFGGLILSSIAPSVGVLYITYGLITGVGYSLAFSTCVITLAHYFKKYRSIASGVALSGGGVGAMVLPYLIRYFMNRYGLQGAIMILGGIMGNLCVAGMLLRPFSSYPRKIVDTKVDSDGHQEHDRLLNDDVTIVVESRLSKNAELNVSGRNGVIDLAATQTLNQTTNEKKIGKGLLHPDHQLKRKLCLSNASLNAITASISCQSIPREIQQLDDSDQVSDIKPPDSPNARFKGAFAFLQEIQWKLFSDPVFVMLFILTFFAVIGYHSLFNIVPPFADEIGLSGENGALIILMFGLSDLLGRIGVGILMDVFPSFRHVLFACCIAFCGVGVILTPMFRSVLSICLFMGSYGFFAGGYNGTIMIIAIDKVGLKNLPSAWGFLCLSASVAMFINPMASGAIKDATGTWINSFRFTGSLQMVAILLLIAMPWVEKKQKAKAVERKMNTSI